LGQPPPACAQESWALFAGQRFCSPPGGCGNGTICLAEGLLTDFTVTPPPVRARWIPASLLLTEWLKAP